MDLSMSDGNCDFHTLLACGDSRCTHCSHSGSPGLDRGKSWVVPFLTSGILSERPVPPLETACTIIEP